MVAIHTGGSCIITPHARSLRLLRHVETLQQKWTLIVVLAGVLLFHPGWYRAEISLKKLENSVINPEVKSLEVVSTRPSRPTSGTCMREILPVKNQLDTTSGEKQHSPYLISLPVSPDSRKLLLNREEQQVLGVVPKMALLKAGNITKIIAGLQDYSLHNWIEYG